MTNLTVVERACEAMWEAMRDHRSPMLPWKYADVAMRAGVVAAAEAVLREHLEAKAKECDEMPIDETQNEVDQADEACHYEALAHVLRRALDPPEPKP